MSSAQVPDGYKQTEIGVIPEDWEVKTVAEIGSVKGGKRLPKGHSLLDTPTPHPYIRVADMRWGYVPKEVAPVIKNYRVNSSDIFISVAGTLGIVGVIPEVLDGANLTENADKITDINCDKNFLLYSLMSERIQCEIDSQRTVGAQPKLALNRIESFLLALPINGKEQQTIAQALSDVDALIASLDKLIAKQRHLKTAAMQQLLTGKMRLPGFDGKWQTVSMNKHASLKARIGWQALTTEEYLDSGYFILVTGTDFLNGCVNWSTCHFVDEWRYSQDKNIQLRSGDVLLTKDGTIGKVGYVENLPSPATLNSGVFVLRPLGESLYPLFLYYILYSQIFDEFLNKIFAGSTISHLYQKDFVTFEFLAPEKEEQRAIATVLSDMDAAITTLEKRRAKTQAIKQGMMQELLTGRTRLV
jgi:type I restriction enzyme, S subunit